MYCKHCMKQIADGSEFCSFCGRSQRNSAGSTYSSGTNYTYCSVCGARNPASDMYCRSCGASQRLLNNQLESPKNKWIAFLLCLFLGGFGFHRFYVGKIPSGILWLFTLGLFYIGALVDCIMILCGEFTDANGLKLK